MMAVPKATVHKYGDPKSRKYNVRATGKIVFVHAITEPGTVQRGTHEELRRRIKGADGGHGCRALLFGEFVGHDA
jgi:hypothetical protein